MNVVGTSELFNAGLIYADGDKVVINRGSGIAGGYAPMLGGLALVGSGGTLELNAGFPSRTEGSSPVFAFYNGATGTAEARAVRRAHSWFPAGRHDRSWRFAQRRHDRRHV
jgi:hypothetical protein